MWGRAEKKKEGENEGGTVKPIGHDATLNRQLTLTISFLSIVSLSLLHNQYRASNYSSYSSYTSSVEDTFDFFAKKAKEEDFYGLGDLFRDIEQEFSGMKDESSIFKKLGEDLLDFLEGSAYAPVRVSLLTAK